MSEKTDFLKMQIENMKETVIENENMTIGEIVKKDIQEDWTSNHVEAIINTVLAMRQRWKETAEPRFVEYQKNYSHIKTLYDLDNLIGNLSESEFCKKILGMNITKNDNWRYNMLCDMVKAFIEYQKENGFDSDKEAMMDWAIKCNLSQLEEDVVGKLNNVGVATVQNLRMCLGIDTIKPDVHIINALKKIGLGNEVEICELISELTGYKYIELDQIFWHWDINLKS